MKAINTSPGYEKLLDDIGSSIETARLNAVARLSKDLGQRYGKGFGRRNILDMRRFYLAYQKWQAVPAKLS